MCYEFAPEFHVFVVYFSCRYWILWPRLIIWVLWQVSMLLQVHYLICTQQAYVSVGWSYILTYKSDNFGQTFFSWKLGVNLYGVIKCFWRWMIRNALSILAGTSLRLMAYRCTQPVQHNCAQTCRLTPLCNCRPQTSTLCILPYVSILQLFHYSAWQGLAREADTNHTAGTAQWVKEQLANGEVKHNMISWTQMGGSCFVAWCRERC